MSKNLFFCIILLIALTMCRKTSTVTPEKNNEESVTDIGKDKVFIDIDDDISVELDNNKYDIYVKDSDSNKLIGYVDLSGKFPKLHIGDLYIYEKYIVMKLKEFYQDSGLWYNAGFCIYEYNENFKIIDYLNSGNKLYNSDDGPYYFEGINNDFLFIDKGTGPGIRGIEVFDLVNNVNILNASYYDSFSFYNNIVSGLAISESRVKKGLYDDIKTKFYELKQETNMPDWLKETSSEFIVHYEYNVLTKEKNITLGEYIYTQ
jgi:hypothetical protein